MSHNEPPRHRSIHDPDIHDPERAEAVRARDERIRDPYEAQRPVRTFGDDRADAAHAWDAAHGHGDDHFAHDRVAFDSAGRPMRDTSPSWAEQPARYGGGYRDADADASARDATGYRGRRRGSDDHPVDHTDRGQSNSGYDTRDADNARLRRHAERHPEATTDPRGQHPRHARVAHDGDPSRGWVGAQDGRQDTYGSAGYRQQGKRYWFDEAGDRAGRADSFRGVRPRNYVRSDERLRELINEQLTDADLDASDIEVTVESGAVTLEGSVGARWMKHMAEDIVDECGGVADIHNHLRVRRPNEPGQPAATVSGAAASAPVTEADSSKSSADGAEAAAPASTNDSNRKH